MTKQEERMMIIREQGGIFEKIFLSENAQGETIGLGEMMQAIHHQIRGLRQDQQNKKANQEQQIIEALQQLRQEISQLGRQINAPAAEMTLQVVSELKKSLATMMEDFHRTLSSSALSQLDELAHTLSAAGKNMAELPLRMETLSANLDVTFGNLRQLLTALSDSSLGQQAETVRQTQVMLQQFAHSVNKLEQMNSKVEQSILRIHMVQEHVTDSCTSMRDFGTFMRKSSDNFLISQESFSTACDQFLKENNKVVHELYGMVRLSVDNARENEARYDNIRNGLQDIFAQIEEGLVQYQGTVGSSIRSYLSEFTQHLTSATSSLASESSKQADLLEELNEILSKIKR